MTSHPLDGVHFRDAFELLHLTDTNFVLHPQLIRCIQACEIADKCYQTPFKPYVSSYFDSLPLKYITPS